MDTSELTALAGSTTERLRALWAEIGEGEEEQHAQLVALKEAVTAVYDRAVASQIETKESLEKEIAANKADIVNTMQQLGCSQEDVDQVDSLADPEATLREQVASLDEAVGTWNARKEERICEISGALTELNQLRFELGEPAVDGFEAIGDDFSESYQRAAVEHVMAAQSLKKEREERRAALIQQLSELVTELCIEGEELTQYDELAVEQNAEAIGLHAATLDAMDERCEELMAIKRARQDHLKSLAEKITALWERLFVSEQERQQFFSNHSGLGTRTLEACEAELERLLVLKQASLKDLIARARARLVELWDILCVPDEERRQFVPAFTDQFTDESLTSHEKLVATLEHRVETMQPLRELVDKREDILAKKIEFDRTSQDPNRFKIPGRLVEEEKFRKVLTKVLPRIEAKLQKQIPAWEADHGPFVLHGRRYLEIIEEASQSRGTKQVTSRVMSHVKKGGSEEAAGAAAATPRPASRAGSRRNSRRDSVKRPGTATRSRTSKENAGNRGTNSKRSTPARASSAVKKNPTRSRATGIPRPTGTTGIPKPQVMTRSKSSSSATSNTSSASSASPTPSASGFVSLADMEV